MSDRNSSHFPTTDPCLSKTSHGAAGLATKWQSPPPLHADRVERGIAYLDALRQVVPDRGLVELPGDFCDRMKMCGWIGLNIHRVNLRLQALLADCEACLYPTHRPSVQILAAPLAPDRGLDGICNLQTQPITLLIDGGRVLSQDWLGAVVHEYAHATVGWPGHDSRFHTTLTHLCLGLGLLAPPSLRLDENLACWPPYRPAPDAAQFWLGNGAAFSF